MKVDARVWEVLEIGIKYRAGLITYMEMRKQLTLDEIQVANVLGRAYIRMILAGKI